MKKGDQLCILRAEVKTDADALNLLRLVAALTAIGIPLDDDCPYLETRELVENVERRLVTGSRRTDPQRQTVRARADRRRPRHHPISAKKQTRVESETPPALYSKTFGVSG